jgi:hypothetical protein
MIFDGAIGFKIPGLICLDETARTTEKGSGDAKFVKDMQWRQHASEVQIKEGATQPRDEGRRHGGQ